MARKADPVKKLVDATMTLAAETGWHDLTLAQIAEKSGVSLVEMRGLVSAKNDILKRFMARIDAEVLEAAAKDLSADDAARDRLFDVLMMRFERLEPYKPALRRIGRDLSRDPAAMLALTGPMVRSMEWMMTAAGVSGEGSRGALKAKGLAAVYLSAMRTWVDDDDPGLARTMAALDRALRRGEDVLNGASVPLGLAGAALHFATAFRKRWSTQRADDTADPAASD